MHPFLLPLTPRLSSSSAKPKGKPRTDQQHRVFIGLEALFFGTLSPGGNARDDDGDFANPCAKDCSKDCAKDTHWVYSFDCLPALLSGELQ